MTNAVFELQPTLIGELVELRPLKAEDWEELFAAASDPLVWEQHPASDRYKEEVFRGYFTGAMESGAAFAVIDKKTGEIIGSTRFHAHDPVNSEIEIGWSFLVRKYWGGTYNKEVKQLLLAHAFKFVDNVVFVVGETNMRSRRAMEKIGGVRTGPLIKRDIPGSGELNIKYVIKKPSTP